MIGVATLDCPAIAVGDILPLATNLHRSLLPNGDRFQPLQKRYLSMPWTSLGNEKLAALKIMPRWADVLANRAHSISTLRRGWDGPRSIPVKLALLDKAVRIVEEALVGARNPVAPYLAPGGDGSIQVEWHEKAGELEFDLGADGSRSIWIRDHRSGEEIEGDDDRAVALFSRWAAGLASVDHNENYVPPSTNTAVSGTHAGSIFYSDNSIT